MLRPKQLSSEVMNQQLAAGMGYINSQASNVDHNIVVGKVVEDVP